MAWVKVLRKLVASQYMYVANPRGRSHSPYVSTIPNAPGTSMRHERDMEAAPSSTASRPAAIHMGVLTHSRNNVSFYSGTSGLGGLQ